VYYLRLYSSHQRGSTYDMPTLKLEKLDQATRDKKVKELYPIFEKELKEYIVEYGRTIKSLQDDEQLILNVRLTRCTDCGIPSTLEAIVKAGVLKDYASGKLSREAAMGKIVIKKGAPQ
jgi:predicted Zn-ribbon and HTH transcriptional regulator